MPTTTTRTDTTALGLGLAAVPTIAQSFALAGAIHALHPARGRTNAVADDRVHALDAAEVAPTADDAVHVLPDSVEEAYGDGSPAAPPTRSERVGAAAGDFATIRVSYGPQNLLTNALNEGRLTALSIRERRAATGRRIPMPVMRTIADLGVGKTWAAEKLVERCAPTDPEDRRRPVLLIELDTSGKQISLPRGILKELGKRGWNHGSDPELLWMRAIDALREFGVEIVIFDEINRAARRPTIGPVIGGDIMDLLVKGDVAVAFLGTEEAIKVFNRCPPLKDRMKAPVVMAPLDWLVEDDRATFVDFLGKMDAALVDNRLTDALSGLGDERIAKPLWHVCRGRLRPLCLLLEEAVTALHREDEGGGDGKRILSVEILAQAVEDLSIPAEVISWNPFTEEMPA